MWLELSVVARSRHDCPPELMATDFGARCGPGAPRCLIRGVGRDFDEKIGQNCVVLVGVATQL